MEKSITILFGFSVMFITYLVLVLIFLFTFSKISRKERKLENKIFSTGALTALSVIFSSSLALIFFSQNIYLYAVVSFLLIILSGYLIFNKFRKLDLVDAMIISAGLAVVLNPAWLSFLGIM